MRVLYLIVISILIAVNSNRLMQYKNMETFVEENIFFIPNLHCIYVAQLHDDEITFINSPENQPSKLSTLSSKIRSLEDFILDLETLPQYDKEFDILVSKTAYALNDYKDVLFSIREDRYDPDKDAQKLLKLNSDLGFLYDNMKSLASDDYDNIDIKVFKEGIINFENHLRNNN